MVLTLASQRDVSPQDRVTEVKRLAEIVKESYNSEVIIPVIDFRLENIKVKAIAGNKECHRGSDPTTNIVIYQGNYQQGSIVSYRINPVHTGEELKAKDYFTKFISPLLNSYFENSDHTPLLKHISYLAYVDRDAFKNNEIFDFYRLFTKKGSYCDITSSESLQSLKNLDFPEEIMKRIEKIKVWKHPSGTLLFDRRVIKSVMQNNLDFTTFFLSFAIEYKIPFVSPIDIQQKYVA